MKTNIEWKYSGKPDGFFGTGATRAEQNLVWFFGILSTALLGWYWRSCVMDWSWWQYVIALLLALDVLGGVVANSLNSCKISRLSRKIGRFSTPRLICFACIPLIL